MKKAEGITFTYDQDSGPPRETNQPEEGADYRAEGPTTFSKTPSEDGYAIPPGNPGANSLPEKEMMNPSSAKVIPDSMREELREQVQDFHMTASFNPYYRAPRGISLQNVIDKWQKGGKKLYDDEMPLWLPVRDLSKYREHIWTRESSRGGYVSLNGKSTLLPGPLKWDALKEDMKKR